MEGNEAENEDSGVENEKDENFVVQSNEGGEGQIQNNIDSEVQSENSEESEDSDDKEVRRQGRYEDVTQYQGHSTELQQRQIDHQQRQQRQQQQQQSQQQSQSDGFDENDESDKYDSEGGDSVYDYEEIDVNNFDHQEYIISICDFEQTEELEELKFFKVLKKPSRSLESWYSEMIHNYNLTHYPRKRA